MISLRLYQQGDLAREIGRRDLDRGELAVGRAAEADWVIPDPTNTLSRRHCVFALDDEGVSVRDQSANGLFLHGGSRLDHGTRTPLKPGQAVALGDYVIAVDGESAPPSPAPLAAPAAPAAEAARMGQLLEAFCAGAGIDCSVFAGEDPQALMRRVGAVYRAMVFGLGELMDDRTRAKARQGLEGTTVQAADNNPFRWAPPQQVAIDLLKPEQDGFKRGAAAVGSSFDDLKGHQQGLVAGAKAAVKAQLDALSPDSIAEGLKSHNFLMGSRAAALWSEYLSAHAAASAQAANSPQQRAFSLAYDAWVTGASDKDA